MIKTQIYMDEESIFFYKRIAKELSVSYSELIRKAMDAYKEKLGKVSNKKLLVEMLDVAGECGGDSTKIDEELYS